MASSPTSINRLKFNRNYYLEVSTIESIPGTPPDAPKGTPYIAPQPIFLPVSLPLTVSFDVKRNYLTSANDCSIRIYNLSQNNRDLIRKNETDLDLSRTVRLYAGYGQNLSLIFTGQIFKCWSVREGVDFISEIECMDGGLAFQKSQFSTVFQEGVSKQQILEAMVQSLQAYGAATGKISTIQGTNTRGNSYDDSTVEKINELADRCFFIDNGVANVLNINDCLNGQIGVINFDDGLLGTPIREQTLIRFEMLFEPRLIIGQYVLLQSFTDQSFNGAYKVISINHRGMISPSVCGEVITSVALQAGIGPQSFNILS